MDIKLLKYTLLISILLLYNGNILADSEDLKELKRMFVSPPESARPGVYWYFMDGNLSKESITKDLESMRQVGIGSVVFFEVNVGVPRGGVDFLSPEWKECFKHAVKECERLGISMILGIGPGWTGSGGPWVKGEESMRHLVSSMIRITGGSKQTISLEKPSPRPPLFDENTYTPELKKRWLDYYEDVAVLAFPTTNGKVTIKDIDAKALYLWAPNSWYPNAKLCIQREEQDKPLETGDAVSVDQIIDLTPLLKDGAVTWNVPPGEWTIMRFGIRNNGAVTRPAPLPGVGFECDKTDSTALMVHLRTFTESLFDMLGERDTTLAGGLKILHMDSWEIGSQNWSSHLREEFKKRRGYDPQPYFPVYAGIVVGNKNISERFLWDLRQTMQELMLENHSLFVKAYARQHGMQLSIEAYDMNPMQDLELGASADLSMSEFWSPGGFNASFTAIEASSVANIKGQRVVPSEAFTAAKDGWRQHPASMKNQTDWAFAIGINRLTFHTFQHQSLPNELRPGMTMGPYGVHWDRNQTWWPYVDAYHTYVARCQYMLQKGQTVADILYLAPEEAPFVFRAPKSNLEGDFMPDKREYNFDACPPSLIYKAYVEDGKIKFPSGMEYRVLVLPVFKTMTLDLLTKIKSLVRDGAVVIGLPPSQTPGLTDYPESDRKLLLDAKNLWDSDELPEGLVSHNYGNGRIIWGTDIKYHLENLYPDFELISKILQEMEVPADFFSDQVGIRYIHKQLGDIDYFFVSNRTDKAVSSNASFRTSGKQPYLWNPVTGTISKISASADNGKHTSLELSFAPYQSYFILFSEVRHSDLSTSTNIKEPILQMTLQGSWSVSFDPIWGGPAQIEFPILQDWSKHSNEGIKYYSGTAEYTKRFDYQGDLSGSLYLDLGTVKNIAKVWLNGKELGTVWTFPWQVDITGVLRNGTNELRIEVTNLWVNRLIGDEYKEYDGIVNGQWPEWLLRGEKRPSSRYTFTTYSHYSKDSPLEESGLLGPVTIIQVLD